MQSIDHYLVQSSDLLDFTNNLQQVTTKQQQILANSTATETTDASKQVSKSEKKLRDTLKTCLLSMVSLHIQFEPEHVVQSSIYLVSFLTKYLTSLFDKASKSVNASHHQDKLG